MKNPIKEPSKDGERLIRNWKYGLINVDKAEKSLKGSQVDLKEATEELAKWLLPESAKVGEKFCIWCVDTLIQASRNEMGNHEISLREIGKYYREL